VKKTLLSMILGALILAVALVVPHALPQLTGRSAVESPKPQVGSIPTNPNKVDDQINRISREMAARIVSEEKEKDEIGKIKADWEKEHYNRPNFISVIYLERATAILFVRKKLLPLERNLTEPDRKRVDDALATLESANERLSDTYSEIARQESR
jgi:hypothetical protein